jgi:hypothetical protein
MRSRPIVYKVSTDCPRPMSVISRPNLSSRGCVLPTNRMEPKYQLGDAQQRRQKPEFSSLGGRGKQIAGPVRVSACAFIQGVARARDQKARSSMVPKCVVCFRASVSCTVNWCVTMSQITRNHFQRGFHGRVVLFAQT